MSGLHDALQALIDGRSLTDAEAELAIGEIMDGGAPDAVVGAFLIALKIKGAEATSWQAQCGRCSHARVR